jgi:hypothetical protein
VFDALPLSYGGDIDGVIVIAIVIVLVLVLVHFYWFSVFLGSTPFNVQLDVPGTQGSPHPSYRGTQGSPHPSYRGTQGSPHPSFTRRGFKGGRMSPLPLL